MVFSGSYQNRYFYTDEFLVDNKIMIAQTGILFFAERRRCWFFG